MGWGPEELGGAAIVWWLWLRHEWHKGRRPVRRPPPAPPPRPSEEPWVPPIRPNDREWRDAIYAPQPTAPDKSVALFRAMLAEAPRVARDPGIAYEDWLVARFRQQGWQVQKTPRSGDYGADVIGTDPRGQTWAIQAKAWQKPVGVHAVQEVLGAKGYYRSQRAAVIATHGFTPHAVQLAQRVGVDLITLLDR